MFLGQYERTLDDKSRLAIPTEFRKNLGMGAVMTRSFDKCLCIYPADRWESLALAVNDFPQVRAELLDLSRALFGSAVLCKFDPQGRVSIPAFLREYGDLKSDAMVVGVNGHVEIWDRDGWLEEQHKFEMKGPALAVALTLSNP